MVKWYVVTVNFSPPAHDVEVRTQFRQELVSAFELSTTAAVRELISSLRKLPLLKGRKFDEYDIQIEEDENQTSRSLRSV